MRKFPGKSAVDATEQICWVGVPKRQAPCLLLFTGSLLNCACATLQVNQLLCNRADLLSRCAEETGSLPTFLHREFTQLRMRKFPGKSAVDATEQICWVGVQRRQAPCLLLFTWSLLKWAWANFQVNQLLCLNWVSFESKITTNEHLIHRRARKSPDRIHSAISYKFRKRFIMLPQFIQLELQRSIG